MFFVSHPTVTFPRFPLVQMADYTRTGHSIFRTVRASLKLASTSSELISIADLSVLRDELQATLAVVKGQIQSEEYGAFAGKLLKGSKTYLLFTENHMALVDMTGWDDSSDEKKKTKKEEAGTAVAGTYLTPPHFEAAYSRSSQAVRTEANLPVRREFVQRVTSGTDRSPQQCKSPAPTQRIYLIWMSYQITGMSLFAVRRSASSLERESPARLCDSTMLTPLMITSNNECFNRGVDRYQVKVNTWAEAVKLYNECYNSGNVVRISI